MYRFSSPTVPWSSNLFDGHHHSVCSWISRRFLLPTTDSISCRKYQRIYHCTWQTTLTTLNSLGFSTMRERLCFLTFEFLKLQLALLDWISLVIDFLADEDRNRRGSPILAAIDCSGFIWTSCYNLSDLGIP